MTLLQSSQPSERYDRKRNPTCKERKGIKPRWRTVLELHLAGHKVSKPTFKKVVNYDGKLEDVLDKRSICDLTGYKEATVYGILAHEDTLYLKQQIMNYYDEEFKALYPEVIDAVRKGLGSEDKYLEAAKVYLKEFGREVKGGSGSIQITAEDVVFNILNQRGG